MHSVNKFQNTDETPLHGRHFDSSNNCLFLDRIQVLDKFQKITFLLLQLLTVVRDCAFICQLFGAAITSQLLDGKFKVTFLKLIKEVKTRILHSLSNVLQESNQVKGILPKRVSAPINPYTGVKNHYTYYKSNRI